MKNSAYILGFLFLFFLGACVDLDRELVTDLSEKQIINSYDFTLNRVNSLYTDMPTGYLQIDGAMPASTTDEAEHTLETSDVQKLNNGSWNAVDNPDNLWATFYRGIRKANQFLAASDSVNLDQYRLDPSASTQAVYNTRLADIKRWKNEARFLRAYFYFELIKRYGGVPLINNALTIDADFSKISRNSLAECIQFITIECDSTAANLPVVYPSVELGRRQKARLWHSKVGCYCMLQVICLIRLHGQQVMRILH
jgi:starch-binding outer membrane protein, SusD/RagB family